MNEEMSRDAAKAAIYARLDSLGIVYEHFSHAPAYTMHDCAEVDTHTDCIYAKNYFLTTKSKKVYCVCIVRPNARFHTADISRQAGTPRLTFADEASMLSLLNTHPGSVSPLGLLFDTEKRVRLLADSVFPASEKLAFHPCDNTETVVLSSRDFFEKFVPSTGHDTTLIEIHDFEPDAE